MSSIIMPDNLQAVKPERRMFEPFSGSCEAAAFQVEKIFMRWTLQGAQLVDANFELPGGDLTVEGSHIRAVGAPSDTPGTVIDATTMIVAPGFIDVHTHGGGGYNLHTVSAEEIQSYARWVPATGVTSFLIGVVGVPDALPEAQLSAAAAAIDTWKLGAEPLGLHLEGPYISVKRRGAHVPSWLRVPNVEEIERVLTLAGGHLRLITLAPELPGAAAVIRRLVEAGITVSIGHSDATYEQTQEAIQLGVTHATHCCNAMRPLHHRDPGPLGAIAQTPQVSGELIADGVHVHPAMMEILIKALGAERTIVITDALSAAGLAEDTEFDFAGQPAHLIHGAAYLADGTLTGSVLTLDKALRNIVQMTGASLQETIGMLTRNPARAARATERKGRLQVGYDADLVILDSALSLQATICQGKVAFATDAWRERLSAALPSDE
jgi:N-acetylglucosamine-6-phosphate deacetylase